MNEFIWKKSRYRLFISQWQIAIGLEAGYKILSYIDDKDSYIKISENVFFCSSLLPYPDSQPLIAEEMECFCKGLKLANDRIVKSLQNNLCLITLLSIQFSDCDIQNDGFTACAIQWTSETFGFSMPVINVKFDCLEPPYRKYIFDFSCI